jgi:hypothetical protein
MKQELEGYRKNRNWWNFSWTAMKMRVLDPEADLNLTPEDWQEMEAKLQEYRENGIWRDFAFMGAKMKILASPEIKIPPEGGLEVK